MATPENMVLTFEVTFLSAAGPKLQLLPVSWSPYWFTYMIAPQNFINLVTLGTRHLTSMNWPQNFGYNCYKNAEMPTNKKLMNINELSTHWRHATRRPHRRYMSPFPTTFLLHVAKS
jgi:hypothetical protein